MGNGTVISLGQVIVDLTMSVEKIPQPGQDVFADEAGIHVGASYNTLCAVRQMGVDARHAGILGTGPGRTRSAGSSRAKAYGMSVPPTKASTPDSAWR